MTEAEFADLAMKICFPALIIFLGFIVWDVAKESKAGRFGTFILFLVLGLGVLGFIIKNIIIEYFILTK